MSGTPAGDQVQSIKVPKLIFVSIPQSDTGVFHIQRSSSQYKKINPTNWKVNKDKQTTV